MSMFSKVLVGGSLFDKVFLIGRVLRGRLLMGCETGGVMVG